MAYDCRLYQVLIASPSDVEEEREIAVRVIQDWNNLHSFSRKVALLPLRWETHTTPEYGRRPQEVINRQIVDQCDLLVAVFWTRIGSPTGEAESGTLEEIERVAAAGKPVMLYFSKVGQDPDIVDLDQLKRLREFKEKTYPNSLTESYRSSLDFRDKFSRQLELKVRDLQKSEGSGQPPLSLSFLDIETGDLVGSELFKYATKLMLTDSENIQKYQSETKNYSKLQRIIDQRIKEIVTVPVVLAIRNLSSSGIRNLYVEMSIIAENSHSVELTESMAPTYGIVAENLTPFLPGWSHLEDYHLPSPLEQYVRRKLSQFQRDGLTRDGDSWKLSFEWGALQPQRQRIVIPHFFVTANRTAEVQFTARMFADSFPEPVTLIAKLKVSVEEAKVNLENLLPDLDTLLQKINEDAERVSFGPVEIYSDYKTVEEKLVQDS